MELRSDQAPVSGAGTWNVAELLSREIGVPVASRTPETVIVYIPCGRRAGSADVLSALPPIVTITLRPWESSIADEGFSLNPDEDVMT